MQGVRTHAIEAYLYVANTKISFGFIRFHNFVDAENCIRVFYFLGYEAKYARVRCLFQIPFRSRLIAEIAVAQFTTQDVK